MRPLLPRGPSTRLTYYLSDSRNYIKDRNITLHHLAADEFAASYDPLSEETVLQALDLILDPANAPILVCCGQGRHRTGTVIGCLRRLQHWALTATLEEYRRCGCLPFPPRSLSRSPTLHVVQIRRPESARRERAVHRAV